MKITDYQKVTELLATNVFILDGEGGTKTILARDLIPALIAITSGADSLGKMNLTQLTQSSTIDAADKILIGVGNGTKAMAANDFLFGLLDSCISVEQRRNIFRGKNLGTALTSGQRARISDGTFKGFFIGDYWEIGGKIWRIVDINYWLNSGDTAFTTPHLVIMPDETLYTAQMNSNNVTNGGYMGSEMYITNLKNAKTLVSSAFGETYILEHKEYLTNAVTDGHASGGAWVNSKVELPNEIQMYGNHIFTASGDGTFVPSLHTIDKTQLALMKIYPRFINPARQTQWLRDVVSASTFAVVNDGGTAAGNAASYARGVRVVFGIKGTAN